MGTFLAALEEGHDPKRRTKEKFVHLYQRVTGACDTTMERWHSYGYDATVIVLLARSGSASKESKTT